MNIRSHSNSCWHRFRTKIFTALTIGGVLASCAEPCRSDTPVVSAANRNQVDQSLIAGEPCVPPCWQGLIPGESTDADTLTTLTDLPFVANDSPVLNAIGESEWNIVRWNSSISNTYPIGEILLDLGGYIKTIWVTLEFEVTVGEVFNLYGQPDVFRITRFVRPGGCHEVVLVWFENGLQINLAFVHTNDRDRVLIAPDTLIHSVTYFAPVSSVREYLLATRRSTDENTLREEEIYYRVWQGYESVTLSTAYPEDER